MRSGSTGCSCLPSPCRAQTALKKPCLVKIHIYHPPLLPAINQRPYDRSSVPIRPETLLLRHTWLFLAIVSWAAWLPLTGVRIHGLRIKSTLNHSRFLDFVKGQPYHSRGWTLRIPHGGWIVVLKTLGLKKMVSVHFSIDLRGRPRRRGTSSSPNRNAVCSTQSANLRLSESEGKR